MQDRIVYLVIGCDVAHSQSQDIYKAWQGPSQGYIGRLWVRLMLLPRPSQRWTSGPSISLSVSNNIVRHHDEGLTACAPTECLDIGAENNADLPMSTSQMFE